MLGWLSGLEISTLYQHSQAGNHRKTVAKTATHLLPAKSKQVLDQTGLAGILASPWRWGAYFNLRIELAIRVSRTGRFWMICRKAPGYRVQ